MKKQNKRLKLTRITLALLILGMIGHAFILPAVAGEPMTTVVSVHSWEELKDLYQASKSGDENLLSTIDSLDEECRNWHMTFAACGGEAELFLRLFNSAKERKFLVPKDKMGADVGSIVLEYYHANGALNAKLFVRYTFFYEGIEYNMSVISRDFQKEMEQENSDPVATVNGDGYSVRVWLHKEEDVARSYYGYVILDGEDCPVARLGLSQDSCPDDISKEVLTKFGEFKVTTIARQLRATRSEQLLQIGRYVLLAAIPVVIVGGALALFAIRKKKEKAKESV